MVVRRSHDPPCLDELCHAMSSQTFEPVEIIARDGTHLAGKWYAAGNGPICILFHGYRGSGIRDFCAIHRICMELGISTLVVDQRAHGMSGGNTMTFGIKERSDCCDWINFARERFGPDRHIYLCGVSMGAATVLMASNLAIQKDVNGIIADCPYSSPGKIIRKVIRDMHHSAGIFYPFVTAGALIFGRFRIWEESAEHAVSQTKIPVLLIHGGGDKFVPPEMSMEIYEHCAGDRFIEIFPEAGHGGCSAADPERYKEILRSFMRHCGK